MLRLPLGKSQGGLVMPTVTITMSEKAYELFRNWEKGHRSSRVSAAICLWNAQVIEHTYQFEQNKKVEE